MPLLTYTFDKRIGRGSFADVYLAYGSDGNMYAIKEIQDNYMRPGRLEKEIQVCESLQHPNIVEYVEHYHCDDKDSTHIVLEYCDMDLAHVISQKKHIDMQTVKRYVQEMVSALFYLHSMGLAHRDLKPENVLLKDDHVKLSDFGFAKTMSEVAMRQTYCGSPLYMAPEVLCKRKYNTKADLWSLGCILYELCFLITPFKAKTLPKLIENIRKHPVRLPPGHKERIDQDTRELLHGLLQRHPDARMGWETIQQHAWFYFDEALQWSMSFDQGALSDSNSCTTSSQGGGSSCNSTESLEEEHSSFGSDCALYGKTTEPDEEEKEDGFNKEGNQLDLEQNVIENYMCQLPQKTKGFGKVGKARSAFSANVVDQSLPPSRKFRFSRSFGDDEELPIFPRSAPTKSSSFLTGGSSPLGQFISNVRTSFSDAMSMIRDTQE